MKTFFVVLSFLLAWGVQAQKRAPVKWTPIETAPESQYVDYDYKAPSPDNQFVLFGEAGRNEAMELRTDAGALVTSYGNGDNLYIESPRFHASSSHLIYREILEENGQIARVTLKARNLSAGTEHVLANNLRDTDEDMYKMIFSGSKPGSDVVFQQDIPGTGVYSLLSVSPDGGTPKVVSAAEIAEAPNCHYVREPVLVGMSATGHQVAYFQVEGCVDSPDKASLVLYDMGSGSKKILWMSQPGDVFQSLVDIRDLIRMRQMIGYAIMADPSSTSFTKEFFTFPVGLMLKSPTSQFIGMDVASHQTFSFQLPVQGEVLAYTWPLSFVDKDSGPVLTLASLQESEGLLQQLTQMKKTSKRTQMFHRSMFEGPASLSIFKISPSENSAQLLTSYKLNLSDGDEDNVMGVVPWFAPSPDEPSVFSVIILNSETAPGLTAIDLRSGRVWSPLPAGFSSEDAYCRRVNNNRRFFCYTQDDNSTKEAAAFGYHGENAVWLPPHSFWYLKTRRDASWLAQVEGPAKEAVDVQVNFYSLDNGQWLGGHQYPGYHADSFLHATVDLARLVVTTKHEDESNNWHEDVVTLQKVSN